MRRRLIIFPKLFSIPIPTPQGGSDLICDRTVFEGNRCIRYRSFAHPLAMLPEPLKGFSYIIHAYIIHEH